MGIQNPRKLGEEPPKKSLVGNLFDKMKHYCKKDPKIQLGPNVSVKGIPALEVVNLPNNIGYCIQIEKKYVTPGISKAHAKSSQAQVTIHQPGDQLHPEADKTFFWTIVVIGVVLLTLFLVFVIIVCATQKQEEKAEPSRNKNRKVSRALEVAKISRKRSRAMSMV